VLLPIPTATDLTATNGQAAPSDNDGNNVVRREPPAPSLAQLNGDQSENAIELACQVMVDAPDRSSQFATWSVFSELIKGRSREAVARPEQARGLA
jgi:hypothetical protein